MTNGDGIRSMTDEELANKIWELAKQIKLLKLESKANVEYWLKQEAKEND